MIGTVISYLALAAAAVGADPSEEICAAAGAACEPPAAVSQPGTLGDAPLDGGGYATPAQVMCAALDLARSRSGRADGGGAVVWTCDHVVLDAWYRVSRTADGERPSGGFAPPGARLPRSPNAACRAPSEEARTPASSGLGLQPLAIFAVPELMMPPARSAAHDLEREIPTRTADPPDRPPRRG
jgi:hypothetical protein